MASQPDTRFDFSLWNRNQNENMDNAYVVAHWDIHCSTAVSHFSVRWPTSVRNYHRDKCLFVYPALFLHPADRITVWEQPLLALLSADLSSFAALLAKHFPRAPPWTYLHLSTSNCDLVLGLLSAHLSGWLNQRNHSRAKGNGHNASIWGNGNRICGNSKEVKFEKRQPQEKQQSLVQTKRVFS